MKYISLMLAVIILFSGVGYFLFVNAPVAEAPRPSVPDVKDVHNNDATMRVQNFSDCVAAGNPIMESYPRQCHHEGVLYSEDSEISNPLPTAPIACTADAKLCPDGSAVGRVAPDCSFAPCPNEVEPISLQIMCPDEVRGVSECDDEYAPVCGLEKVQCFAPPCDPVPVTFSNVCNACSRESVVSYTAGVCEVE